MFFIFKGNNIQFWCQHAILSKLLQHFIFTGAFSNQEKNKQFPSITLAASHSVYEPMEMPVRI